MPVEVVIITDLPEVGARIEAAGAAVPGIIEGHVVPIADAIEHIGTAELRDATPKASGATAASTRGETHIEGEGAEIIWHQDRQVHSSHGSWYLAKILIEGRGPVDIVPIAGLGNGFLFWEGAEHPVRQVHQPARDPNPYNKEAMDAAQPAIHDAIGMGGHDILREVVRIMQ